MINLLQQAINCDDADRTAKMIQDQRERPRRRLLLPHNLADRS
jgi:hypothetical protein